MHAFFDTLAFMTRLGNPRVMPEESFKEGMKYMVPVGAVLGLVVVLPFELGLFSGLPWIQAWLMVLLSIFLTRGLHFDGLADVCDAVTTHTDPEKFWLVIKDSRAGAFGVLGLVMAVLGQVAIFHYLAQADKFGVVLWTFILGRAAVVWLGYHVRHLTRPGLGKLHIDGATLGVALSAAAITVITGFVLAGFWATIAATVAVSLALFPLYRLAEKVGAVNGDFLGCAVLFGELSAGLGCLLVM